ncbi:Putative ribonuclease H protein At1g65750, partial [Linum perenne]
CYLGTFSATYLGLPLGSKAADKQIWDPVIACTRNRNESWKAKLLSFGGRVTLLKSVLSSLPIYYLSLFKALVSVVKELERMQNRFLLEGHEEERKPHLVSWDMVKTPMRKGGLGILVFRAMNEALLGKWMWRFVVERNAWWRRLIVYKTGCGASEWKPICGLQGAGWSIWHDIVSYSSRFWQYALLDPGGGEVSFWFDSWAGGECLAVRFPRIAAATQSREVSLFD